MSRETAHRVFKVVLCLSAIGMFGGLFSVIVLPYPVRCVIGSWLTAIHPYGGPVPENYDNFPAKPSSYDAYAFTCGAISMALLFICFAIGARFFSDLEAAETEKKLSDPKTFRLGMTIVVAGVATVMTAPMLQGKSFLVGAAILLYSFIRKMRTVDSMLLAPMEANKRDSDALEFMRTGRLSGVKVDLSIASVTPMSSPFSFARPESRHTTYFARVETVHRDLQFVIQRGGGLLDLGALPYSPVQLTPSLHNCQAVSNDPVAAEAIIARNANTLTELLKWASFVALNLPPNTQPDTLYTRPEEDPADFDGTGVYMAVRSVPKRDKPSVSQTAMELLVALSKGSNQV